jgi:CO/xanthine dehydrogenase Mo-binding subunit
MGQFATRKNKNRRLVVSRHWLASAALGHSRDGGIEQRNFDSYTPMRMSQIHEIDVSIIGDGEPAVMVIAIGNALFNAGGPRVRSLPITAGAVKAAMKSRRSDE